MTRIFFQDITETDLNYSHNVSFRILVAVSCLLWSYSSLNAIIASQLSLPSVSTLLRLFTIISSYILQIVFLDQPVTLFSTLEALGITLGVATQVLSLYCDAVGKEKAARSFDLFGKGKEEKEVNENSLKGEIRLQENEQRIQLSDNSN